MYYLYIKTHNETGLKYLGKTNQKDYHSYPGSGVRWKRHLEKHCYDYRTDILLVTDDKNELKETGIFFSKIFNIVKSKEWANLQEEKGDGVSSEFALMENHRRLEEGTHPFCDPLYNQKTNNKRQDTKRKNGTHNFLGGKIQQKRVENGTHHLLSGEIQRKSNLKRIKDGTHNFIDNIKCVDENGIIFSVSKQDYDSDDSLVHINSSTGKKRLGKETVTDKQRKYLDTKIQCPYCNKQGNISNMKRWHFDKCKMNIGE